MNINTTTSPDERARLLDDVDRFCRALRPVEDRCYLERRFNDQLVPLAREHGLLGMHVPAEYGGRGADAATYALALARIGHEGTGVRTFFSGHSSIGQGPILAAGNAEQRGRLLPPTCRGERICAFALTEPQAGSDPKSLRATYRLEGDSYILNGEKYLISNGTIADLVVTFARPEGGGRIGAFVVAADATGFEAEELGPKVGNPTADTARIALKDCPVPVADRLGAEGDGLRVAMGALVGGRLSVAAGCLGVIEDCLAEALAFAKGRHQHGKPIAKHQLVQAHLAEIELARATTESLVLRAAQAKAAAESDPSLHDTADHLAALAKWHAARAACDAADRAVQVFGGRGFLEENRPGRHYRDARVCRLYEGTDEILTLKVAAKLLGKEYEAFQ
ncbi:MAG TPA: acyl-CoA dehydrogenase family protein [Isosphaeraceae bacterium]|jgi:alkylation response protein AidB-like acyl-CoA dehydrogenase|nr:acyl-CoA dehydrogenase family protein [Isosphaeraceae bacterium]